ncbi:hypothetical protein HDU76_002282, partial [Blyttiomyces sp. JEL0837]
MTTRCGIEVIIVDGGSRDGTIGCVRRIVKGCREAREAGSGRMNVVLIEGAAGLSRGRRVNIGVRAARGDFVVLMHADSLLPNAFDRVVMETLIPYDLGKLKPTLLPTTKPIVAGVLPLAVESSINPADDPHLPAVLWCANYATERLEMPFHPGQVIFLRTETFRMVGGCPDQMLFERYELVRRVARVGRFWVAPREFAAVVGVDGGRSLVEGFGKVVGGEDEEVEGESSIATGGGDDEGDTSSGSEKIGGEIMEIPRRNSGSMRSGFSDRRNQSNLRARKMGQQREKVEDDGGRPSSSSAGYERESTRKRRTSSSGKRGKYSGASFSTHSGSTASTPTSHASPSIFSSSSYAVGSSFGGEIGSLASR